MRLRFRAILYLLKHIADDEVISLNKEVEFRLNLIAMRKTLEKISVKHPPLQYVYDTYDWLNRFLFKKTVRRKRKQR